MADVSIPNEIVQWMNGRNWGQHHLRWHVERMWDRLPAPTQAWATQQGWSRYRIQEGQETNGLAFLAMHRAMINMLKAAFPAHVALFSGWAQPPINPADTLDPVPPTNPQTFDQNMATSVARLHGQLGTFDGEDDLGLFVESSWRPFPNQAFRQSRDPASGIHNYLHGRFQDNASPINMGNPEVNLQNRQFWRVHGWIDGRWTTYRTMTGRVDTDRDYITLLQEASAHMGHAQLAAGAEPKVVMPQEIARHVVDALTMR